MDTESPKAEKTEDSTGESTESKKKKLYWKSARIATVFGMIELLSLVLWIKSEDFPDWAYYLRWFASCGFVAGAAYLAHKLVSGPRRKSKIGIIWVAWGLLCFVLFLTKSKGDRQQMPRFVLSLRTDDSPESEVFLTNDFLFISHWDNIGSNGWVQFTGYSDSVIVIPVRLGESNKVFNFSIETDSSVKANELQVMVGLPKDSQYSMDIKWHETSEMFVKLPWSKVVLTNFQAWVAQDPWALFTGDSWRAPAMTNRSITPYSGPQTMANGIFAEVRGPGSFRVIFANVVFLPASSNFSKPFVTRGKFNSDGVFTFPFLDSISN